MAEHRQTKLQISQQAELLTKQAQERGSTLWARRVLARAGERLWRKETAAAGVAGALCVPVFRSLLVAPLLWVGYSLSQIALAYKETED